MGIFLCDSIILWSHFLSNLFHIFPHFSSHFHFLLKVLFLRFIQSSHIINIDQLYDHYFPFVFLSSFCVLINQYDKSGNKNAHYCFLGTHILSKSGTKIYTYSNIWIIFKLAKSFLKTTHFSNLFTLVTDCELLEDND